MATFETLILQFHNIFQSNSKRSLIGSNTKVPSYEVYEVHGTSAVTQTSLKGNSSFLKKNVYKTLTENALCQNIMTFLTCDNITPHSRGIGLLSKRIEISSFQGQIVI